MGFSEQMSLVATITGVVGGVAGLVALAISVRADRRAARAEKQSEKARQQALWSELIIAMQELVGANVLSQDLRPLLVRVRTAMTELLDGIPKGLYTNIDRWLAAEHRVLSLLFEQALRKLGNVEPTVENIEDAHRAANEWSSGFVSNLRFARASEAGREIDDEIAKLTDHAVDTSEKLLAERSRI
jgi:hypothetical protein